MSATQLTHQWTSREVHLLSHLYLHQDYPYSTLTIAEAAKMLNVSHATIIQDIKKLEKEGTILKVKSYLVFIYPIEDNDIRKEVLQRIGFFSGVEDKPPRL